MKPQLPEEVIKALAVLGFGSKGLIKKSIAAGLFGKIQPAKGAYATMQSAGAGGYGVKILCEKGKHTATSAFTAHL
ncbi:hypothetical protein BROUX41_001936 [Berkeleyomyces rouxiae]|uniref:uncharacterized protein n=1 Tax=Berkeleyomyces rouxiae TaxID=2035830 RepID=UPI003B80A652